MNHPKSHKYLAATTFIICLATSHFPAFAEAQNSEQEEFLLEVSLEDLMDLTFETASKYKESTNDAPSVSTIISAEEIAKLGATNLFEVMEKVTSVYMTGSNFFPQNVMAMRGILLGHYDNHILMLFNGRPVRESYAGGVNFAIYNAFPLDSIERLEIIRGPGSVLYGTNAYAGVVNIITKKSDESSTKVSLAGGSLDAKSVSLHSSISEANYNIQWGVNYFNENGWDFSAIDNNGDAGNKNYGEDNLGGYVSAKLYDVELNAFYVRSDQDFIGASFSWSGTPPIEERFMKSDRLFVDLGREFNIDQDWYIDANVSYSEMEFDHYNYIAYSNDTFAELTSHWQIMDGLRWILGGTAWYQEVGSKGKLRNAPVPDFDATWYSLYTQLDYSMTDKLKLIAGTQLNKAENVKSDLVPRFGMIYKFSPKMGLKIMYAEAFRAAFGVETGFSLILTNPDGSIRGGLRGNPSLNPETIKTTDVQLYYNDEQYQLAVTFFNSQLENLVARERAADNVLDFINEGQIDNKGLEFEFKINATRQLYIVGSYSYQTNENDEGIRNFTTVPNDMFKAGFIYYFPSGTTFGMHDLYIGSATDIAVVSPNRQAVNPNADSHHIITANLTFDLDTMFNSSELSGSKLSISGYNLLNESIYHPEFIGKRVNTLSARSERALYLELSFEF